MRDNNIKGLPVVTEAGDSVGKVTGMVIDIDSHQVIQYLVSKSRLLSALLPEELMIHHNQVISVTEEQMTVRGGLTEIEAAAESFKQQVRDAAASAVSHSAITKTVQE
jgi:sporulation protein YlmC with PRC-barrel domain